jgi:hypothetical protein
MNSRILKSLPDFLGILDLDEEPVGLFYTDKRPAEGLSPKPTDLPTRPEPLCGLHQLAAFVTNDPEVVASPWGAGCGSIAAWPLHYLAKKQNRAVIGGWDPSARKFYKTDELSFTVPFQMFQEMLARYQESFLTTKTWETARKKILRSKKAWGETSHLE